MLFEVEIERYGLKALTPEQVEFLKKVSITEVTFDATEPGRLEWGCKPIMSAEALREFPGAKLLRVIDNESTQALAKFGQRTTTVMNERCQVVVPGLGLLVINEVQLRTDHCTDALQKDLNLGWRILAICIQPDQRRPDYVLGRTSETEAQLK